MEDVAAGEAAAARTRADGRTAAAEGGHAQLRAAKQR